MLRFGVEVEHAQLAVEVVDSHTALRGWVGKEQTSYLHDQIAVVKVWEILDELQDLLARQRHRMLLQQGYIVLGELLIILQWTWPINQVWFLFYISTAMKSNQSRITNDAAVDDKTSLSWKEFQGAPGEKLVEFQVDRIAIKESQTKIIAAF